MNTTEINATVKIASFTTDAAPSKNLDSGELRSLSASEWQLVGGGDVAVGIR